MKTSTVAPASCSGSLTIFPCSDALAKPFDLPNAAEVRRKALEPTAVTEDLMIPRNPNLKQFKDLLRPYLLTEDTRVARQNREQAFKEVLLRLGRSRRYPIMAYYHVPFLVNNAFVITPDFFLPEVRVIYEQRPGYLAQTLSLSPVLEPHDKYGPRSVYRMEAFHEATASTIFYVIAPKASKEFMERNNRLFRLGKIANDLWKIPNGDTEFKEVKRAVKKRVANFVHNENCVIVNREDHTDDTQTKCYDMVEKGIWLMKGKKKQKNDAK